MPQFTLFRSNEARDGNLAARSAQSTADEVPDRLRSDRRVTIIDEMPRMLLIDCPTEVANEWLAQMPGVKLQPERRARIPDPRPKLKAH
jgi:hypothetical protein